MMFTSSEYRASLLVVSFPSSLTSPCVFFYPLQPPKIQASKAAKALAAANASKGKKKKWGKVRKQGPVFSPSFLLVLEVLRQTTRHRRLILTYLLFRCDHHLLITLPFDKERPQRRAPLSLPPPHRLSPLTLSRTFLQGKLKEKVNNQVLFDKATYEKLNNEIVKSKLITVSTLSDRLRVTGSLARAAIRELKAKGAIKPIAEHASQVIYTRAVGGN